VTLALPAWWWWPPTLPDARAWSFALVLAVACTGIAYVLYFRLIANVGPANAISVTFLIPVFAVLWGWLFLHESLTPQMLLGCAVILLGTSLTTGVLKPPAWFSRHPA
jgi:drug/metabolite transporter (DMT)-like permease